MRDMNNIKRGEIYYADLRPVVGSEQGGIRPVLVIQNDIGNKYSPTTIVVVLTSRSKKAELPTHITIHSDMNNGLKTDSVALCEQFRTIDKKRIINKIGRLDDEKLSEVMDAFKVSVSL